MGNRRNKSRRSKKRRITNGLKQYTLARKFWTSMASSSRNENPLELAAADDMSTSQYFSDDSSDTNSKRMKLSESQDKKNKSLFDGEELLRHAYDVLQGCATEVDESQHFGNLVASKLRPFDEYTRSAIQNDIMQLFLRAHAGHYNRSEAPTSRTDHQIPKGDPATLPPARVRSTVKENPPVPNGCPASVKEVPPTLKNGPATLTEDPVSVKEVAGPLTGDNATPMGDPETLTGDPGTRTGGPTSVKDVPEPLTGGPASVKDVPVPLTGDLAPVKEAPELLTGGPASVKDVSEPVTGGPASVKDVPVPLTGDLASVKEVPVPLTGGPPATH